MPAVSEKQRKFMGAELNRKRAGKKTKTGMSESKLSEFASKSMDAITVYLDKADIPDVKIKPGERIGGPGDRIQLVPKKPKPKKNNVFVKSLDLIDTYLDIIQPQNDNSFAKSMSLIDIYLFKHARVLPCGHHAEEGTEIDKACSVSGCDTSSFTTPRGHTTVNIGTSLTSAPVTDSTTGQATTVGALPGARTHMGRTSFAHTPTGGAVSSGGTATEDVDEWI